MKPLIIVVSPSTKKYIESEVLPWTGEDYDILIVKCPPTVDILKDENTYEIAWAVGGGSVIDTAKIIAKYVFAIPTTYSGASQTSHAVYWDKDRKKEISTNIPTKWVSIPSLLPQDVKVASKIDCLCHIIESLISPKANKKSRKEAIRAIDCIRDGRWLDGSIHAGNAIEITGTNLLHSMSYPLSAKYKLPHGVALAKVIEMAKEYKKFHEV